LHNGRLTSAMILQLASSSSLRSLQSNYGPAEIADHDFPRLDSNSFLRLERLSLTVGVQNVTRFLTTAFDPRSLATLEITISPIPASTPVPHNETPHVQGLLFSIASRCPSLQKLVLDLLNHSSRYTDDPPDSHLITFDTLEPLVTCQHLREFSISHEYRPSLDAADIERLAQSWPLMESLSLNPHPTSLRRPIVSIDILTVFSVLCPNIHHLGLHLDLRRETVKALDPFWHSEPITSLLTLDVGTSELATSGAEITVGAYIAFMCPNLQAVQTNAPWKGRLQIARDQAVSGQLDAGDRLHIIYIEKTIAFRSVCWAASEKLALRLIKSVKANAANSTKLVLHPSSFP